MQWRLSGVNLFSPLKDLFSRTTCAQGQFQPNGGRNMLGGWEFRFVQINGRVPFGVQ